jgi:hypothetical protein
MTTSGDQHPLTDTTPLIGQKSTPDPVCTCPLLLFLVIKVAPWALYTWPHTAHYLTLTTFLFLAIADVWVSDRVFSEALLGVSWGIDPIRGIVFTFADDVDSPLLSRSIFWVALISSAIVATGITLMNLIRLRLTSCALVTFVALLHWINVTYCIKGAAQARDRVSARTGREKAVNDSMPNQKVEK